jgi:hypothetical protein
MKKLIPIIAALAFLLTAFSGAAFAQEDEQGAKNLYLAHGRDSKRGRPGVKITIELKREGVTQKVPLNYVFSAGDKVKFHFETNFNAYVKVINIGSTGALQLLYPYRGAAEFVTRARDYAIPQGDLWFEFDRNPGTEQLTFVFSSQPLLAESQRDGAAPRPDQGGVTANRPGHSARSNGDEQKALRAVIDEWLGTQSSARSNGAEQRALADLNSLSLENGKDFNLVQDTQENGACAYGVATTQAVRKPIGVRINLRHQ